MHPVRTTDIETCVKTTVEAALDPAAAPESTLCHAVHETVRGTLTLPRPVPPPTGVVVQAAVRGALAAAHGSGVAARDAARASARGAISAAHSAGRDPARAVEVAAAGVIDAVASRDGSVTDAAVGAYEGAHDALGDATPPDSLTTVTRLAREAVRSPAPEGASA